MPGLCAGLVLALEQVPARVDLAAFPVLRALVRGGPAALVKLAGRHGFVPEPTYSSPRDLCTHVRLFLFRHAAAPGFPELGPPGFYDADSVGGYGL